MLSKSITIFEKIIPAQNTATAVCVGPLSGTPNKNQLNASTQRYSDNQKDVLLPVKKS